MEEPDAGGHRGLGAAVPVAMTPISRRCRRFVPRELEGFVFPTLQDELVVDDVYLRVLVKEAVAARGSEAAKLQAGAGEGLGRGLALPTDLLASVFVYLGDQMRLIVAGQVPNVTSDRQLFFQDVSLLLQALLGLAVGEAQVCVCVCACARVFVVNTKCSDDGGRANMKRRCLGVKFAFWQLIVVLYYSHGRRC